MKIIYNYHMALKFKQPPFLYIKINEGINQRALIPPAPDENFPLQSA